MSQKCQKETLFLKTLTSSVFRWTHFPKLRTFRPKKDAFFNNQGHMKLPKNRPFLSEIENDDAYPVTSRVGGPGSNLLRDVAVGEPTWLIKKGRAVQSLYPPKERAVIDLDVDILDQLIYMCSYYF